MESFSERTYSPQEEWIIKALAFLLEGHTYDKAREHLTHLGAETTDIDNYVKQAKRLLLRMAEQDAPEMDRRNKINDLIWGAVWATGGGLLTSFSHESDVSIGIILIYGVIIFGLKVIQHAVKTSEKKLRGVFFA